MAKAQREKGKGGEREVASILRDRGFKANRESRNWANDHQDLIHDIEGVHIEVKRQERLCIPAWTRQAAEDAGEGETPVVAYRRSREPWMAVLPLEALVDLLADSRDLERVISG